LFPIQSLFQFPVMSRADSRSRSVLPDRVTFATGDRLRRPGGKLVRRVPVQPFLSSGVRVRINPGGIDAAGIGPRVGCGFDLRI
jgi:hypothetical protein